MVLPSIPHYPPHATFTPNWPKKHRVKSNDNPTERWSFGQMIILPGLSAPFLEYWWFTSAGLEKVSDCLR